ncbi:MAG: phosphate/phosphite/phosphonate ABC transporter substrate-binding protein [Acidimicrobiia bacterium]|nr:phosphate/phosphite/phosphonate ABC transporter substrate-binding protein [Acidimicrobiia bacterium]
MKKFHKLAVAIFAVVSISAITGGAALALKAGDACTKAQLKKTSGNLTCTYDSKTKKYKWASATKIDKKGWPEELVLGVVPSENAASQLVRMKNFITVLSQDTGLPVKFYSVTDYAGIIEAQVARRIDVAWYGPFSYVLAKARGAKIEPFAAPIPSATGKPGYYSYGITKSTNSNVTKLGDFKDKNVCFVDAASTSGYLYPLAGLLSLGIQTSDYKSVFAGGHDKSVLAVKSGQCDVGFAYDDMVDVNLVEKGLIQKGEIKVVWKSNVIAGSPMAVRVDLPKSLQDVIKKSILEMNVPSFVSKGLCATEKGCYILEDSSWGFVKVDDAYYDGIRQVCESTRSSKCK